jgi:hypothetical protein
VEDLVQEDARYDYGDPPDAQEIDPIVGRLSRMEEVQRQFLEAMDGLSRAISLLADEASESRRDFLERLEVVRDIVVNHQHGLNSNVLVPSYMARETSRRG